MDKFWDWMFKKGYGYGNDKEHFICAMLRNETIDVVPYKQMLIGFMIEYLTDCHSKLGRAGFTVAVPYCFDYLYKNLEKEINDME